VYVTELLYCNHVCYIVLVLALARQTPYQVQFKSYHFPFHVFMFNQNVLTVKFWI